MKNDITLKISCLVLCLALSSCERMEKAEQTETITETPALSTDNQTAKAAPVTVQEALRADARLARSMNLASFSKYMQSRHNYYKQFEKVSYEDEFVKIKIEGEDLKIETGEGKAKFEEDEAKIKTDTYKRKWDRN